MVRRVYGNVDGVEIIFTPVGNRWECAIPNNLQGRFVVDLYAEDDAGNRAYCATMLFTVDASKLRVKMQVLQITTASMPNSIDAEACVDRIGIDAQLEEIKTIVRLMDYAIEVIACERV